MDKEIIKKYLNSGLSVLPTNGTNGNSPKAPAIHSWAIFQQKRMFESEVPSLFENAGGVGIIGGKISGNLTIIDFDNHDGNAKKRFGIFIRSTKSIIEKYTIPYETTPSGGYHVYIRSDSCEGNKKLAQIIFNKKKDTIIETRAEGGYALGYPSDGYKLMYGSLEKIPTISKEEKEYMLKLCSSFDNANAEYNEPILYKGSSARPGDEYNISERAKEEIPVLLKRAGWTKAGGKYWVRPNKTVSQGVSATFGHVVINNIPLFHVFSSNAYPFEDGKNYTPFSVFAILEFSGDFSKAAKELVSEGLGNQQYNVEERRELPIGIQKKIMEGERRLAKEERERYVSTEVEDDEDTGRKKKKSPIIEAKEFLSTMWQFRLNVINNSIQARRVGQMEWGDINENDVWIDVNEYGIRMSKDNVKSILGSSFVPEYNPFREYFENLPEYDGVDYFDELTKYMKIDDPVFFRDMLEKHCVRAIKCALEDEYYNRMVFVLQSKNQEIGKSRFIHSINPFGNLYFSEQPLSENKDCQIALSQTFIYNLEELDDLKSSRVSAIKANLAKYTILERKPYAAQSTMMPRRCTFFASTNYAEFLTDNVNTRWLIFKVDAIDESLWAKLNPQDLWSQAWALYNDPTYIYELTTEEKVKREDRNKSFKEVPMEFGLIIKYFEAPEGDEERNWMFVPEIIKEMTIRAGYGIRITNNTTLISSQLDTLGFESRYITYMNSKIKQYKIKTKND